MARAIKRFIDVEIRKDTPRVSAAGFGIPLVVTDNSLITTSARVKKFLSATAVGAFFGLASEEYKAADAYFLQDPFLEFQPEKLWFGRFADASTAAVIECGQAPETDLDVWNLVADGEFGVTIDAGLVDVAGLDFSLATTMDEVATVIDTGLGVDGDCIFSDGRFQVISPTTGAASAITLLQTVAAPAGTDISDELYMDGDVLATPALPLGSVLSQGQIAETEAAAIAAIRNVDDDWYVLGGVKKYRDDTTTDAFAVVIEPLRKMFYIATNDANTLILGNAANFCAKTKAKNFKRSGSTYHDIADLYPDMSDLGQQLPKPIGSTNWAYKTRAGIAEGALVDIPATAITSDQIDAALDKNCNVYTNTLGADFTYFGTMLGGKNIDKEGEFIDIIRNIDFLQARVEEQQLSLHLEKDIVPFTNAGITMEDNRLKSSLDTYGVKQGILVEGTVITSFPKRSEVSQENRDDRHLPDGTFQGELTGAIDTVIIRGTVFV